MQNWLGRRWLTAVIAAIALLISTGISATGAEAAPTHVFDPILSLTGGCTTSPVDPVADPGCPDLHPAASFRYTTSVAVDSYGNIYVASRGQAEDGSEGRIDVFDSAGFFVTEVPDPAGPLSIAVDSKGTLYVNNQNNGQRLVAYEPTEYDGAAASIEYGDPPLILIENAGDVVMALAINHENDHLLVNHGSEVVEYLSPEETQVVLPYREKIINPIGFGLAVDAAHDRLYATNEGMTIRIFELASPHNLLGTIEGSATPLGKFVGPLAVAVDESTGHVFVYDQEGGKVYEFTEAGKYVSTIEHSFQLVYPSMEIAVDNGPFSPNGGYLFVGSHATGIGHAFAFEPTPPECAPTVEGSGFANVAETEAELDATINPCNVSTTYRFEYVTEEHFQEEGFSGAALAGSGQLLAANVSSKVLATATGLAPDTEYRFRVVASNSIGSDEVEGHFRTYPSFPLPSCPNEAFRHGSSAALPDCRAFELVTPPDTNARAPLGIGILGQRFATREASPAGDKFSFHIEGGAIPGTDATGAYGGDPYLSVRGPAGWTTSYVGPTALEAPSPEPGSNSPDQGYSFWKTGGEGTAALAPEFTSYVRYPDGHSEPVGRGSLGIEPRATGFLISEGGTHIIFGTGEASGAPAKQLEPDAAPTGTGAVYDRTSDEVTHVISLLPGNAQLKTGQAARYVGASLDGRGVAFSVGKKLYLRVDDSATFEIGEDVTFAGIAEGGHRLFYLEEGRLLRFDAATNETLPFNSTGTAKPVNVSADGSAAYLVSTSVLAKTPNPNGAKPKSGQQNLYFSKEGALSFVGTVTERDVDGTGSIEPFDGLGLWSTAVAESRPGLDPSRTTPDGGVMIFESRANLTGYDAGGYSQIYRYDSGAAELTCLSCLPTGEAATGDATLQAVEGGSQQPYTTFVYVANLRADGRRAFFQTTEPLVPTDTDELQDVYEWEAAGVGSCVRPAGCVQLISSGHSSRIDYLFAVSDSGDDVFFRTSDLLLPIDSDETPSIYDARVNGGFSEPEPQVECQGEGCRPGLTEAPALSEGNTPVLHKGAKHRPCPKGKRRVKQHGKTRCVKKSHRHRHKAGSKQKGAGK